MSNNDERKHLIKNSHLLHLKLTGKPSALKKCNFGCFILPEITWNVFFCSLLWRSLQLVDNHQTSNKNLEQWEHLQELSGCFWFHIIIWMTFSSNQPLLSNLKLLLNDSTERAKCYSSSGLCHILYFLKTATKLSGMFYKFHTVFALACTLCFLSLYSIFLSE